MIKIDVGDVIRIQKPTKDRYENGYRVYRVTGVYLGGHEQEDCYGLRTLDLLDNNNSTKEHNELFVPMIIIDTNPNIEKI